MATGVVRRSRSNAFGGSFFDKHPGSASRAGRRRRARHLNMSMSSRLITCLLSFLALYRVLMVARGNFAAMAAGDVAGMEGKCESTHSPRGPAKAYSSCLRHMPTLRVFAVLFQEASPKEASLPYCYQALSNIYIYVGHSGVYCKLSFRYGTFHTRCEGVKRSQPSWWELTPYNIENVHAVV